MNAHIIALVDLELMKSRRAHPSLPDSVFDQTNIVGAGAYKLSGAARRYEDGLCAIDPTYAAVIEIMAVCVRMLEEGSAKLRS